MDNKSTCLFVGRLLNIGFIADNPTEVMKGMRRSEAEIKVLGMYVAKSISM